MFYQRPSAIEMLALRASPGSCVVASKAPPRVRPCAALRHCVAIGFSQTDAPRGDRQAARLLRDAASLLVLQGVCEDATSKAFLSTLSALRDGQSALPSYGAFFTALASAQTTWSDHVLDALLRCESPLSLAAARGEAPSAAVRAAAASDLDALQRLCAAESTLAGWVADSCDGELSPAWLKASSMLSYDHVRAEQPAEEAAEPSKWVVSPSASQRAAWRQRLRSQPRWSDCVAHLKAFHARHGVGAITQSRRLIWSAGRLAPDSSTNSPSISEPPIPSEVPSAYKGSKWDAVHGAIADESWPVLLLHGGGNRAGGAEVTSPRDCKTDMEWFGVSPANLGVFLHTALDHALSAPGQEHLCVVRVPRADWKSLIALCACIASKHPRTRFVVTLENLNLVPFGEAYNELIALFAGELQPNNVLLLMTSHDKSGMRPGEELLDGGMLRSMLADDAVLDMSCILL